MFFQQNRQQQHQQQQSCFNHATKLVICSRTIPKLIQSKTESVQQHSPKVPQWTKTARVILGSTTCAKSFNLGCGASPSQRPLFCLKVKVQRKSTATNHPRFPRNEGISTLRRNVPSCPWTSVLPAEIEGAQELYTIHDVVSNSQIKYIGRGCKYW